MNGRNPAPEQPAQTSEFIAVEFVSRHNGAQATLRWLMPQSVVVAVRLAPHEAESWTELHWTSAPAQAATLQAMLARLRDHQAGQPSEYELRLARQGRAMASLAWDARTETEDLAKLRGRLEKIGHLRCAQSIAQQRRGCELAQKGAPALAPQAYRAGIQTLGDLYQDPDTIDDTGMKLVLADHNEKVGRSEVAMNLLAKVLAARISEYLRLQQQANPPPPC